MKHISRISWHFWIAQTFGWCLYYAFLVLSMTVFTKMPVSRVAAMQLFIVVPIGLFSIPMRLIYRRIHWDGSRPLRHLGILAAVIVASATASQVVVHSLLYSLFSSPSLAPFQIGQALVYLGNVVLIYSIWTLIYQLFLGARRRRNAEIDRWKLKADLRDAELRIIKAQINPHFLFNALNNIRSLVTEEPEKARDMITNLSQLLRYAIQHASSDQVALADEIEVVKRYLELESIQLEDRLAYSISVDPSLHSVSIPPMTVQLLAENAIKHGIAKTVGGGKVEIAVKGSSHPESGPRPDARDDVNGRGITAHNLPSFQIRVTNTGTLQNTASGNGNGIGLNALRQRLEAMFQSTAEFSLSAVGDNSVEAKIEVKTA